MSNLKAASIGGDQPEVQAEIPEAMTNMDYALNELVDLVATLHTRLEQVMPPAAPEAGTLTATVKGPDSPLAQHLAEQTSRIHRVSGSVRNLLDRIRL